MVSEHRGVKLEEHGVIKGCNLPNKVRRKKDVGYSRLKPSKQWITYEESYLNKQYASIISCQNCNLRNDK